jgi:integrase
LTADQAARLLAAAEADEAMRAYVVVSLLTGAQAEELRTLTWTHVDLEGNPPTVALWRSVRAGGETKTRQSGRALELPARSADALRVHRKSQRHVELAAGDRWQGAGLVFCTSVGTALDAANVRRSFRRVAAAAGLDARPQRSPASLPIPDHGLREATHKLRCVAQSDLPSLRDSLGPLMPTHR